MTDAIFVPDAFPVSSVEVTVDISYFPVSALKLLLTAAPLPADSDAQPSTIVLKSASSEPATGNSLHLTTFSDTARTPLPLSADAAPYTGSYLPTQRLSFLVDDGDGSVAGEGGSRGSWVLEAADPTDGAAMRTLALNGWSIMLCERPGVEGVDGTASPSPESPSDGASPTGEQTWDALPEADREAVQQELQTTAGASPAVESMQGPPQSAGVGVTAAPGTVPSPEQTFMGWRIVNVGAPVVPSAQDGLALSTTGASAAASPRSGLWNPAQLMPRLSDAYAGYTRSAFGTCTTAACSTEKDKLWKGAVFVLYASAALDAQHARADGAIALLRKVRDRLPENVPNLTAFLNWLDSNNAQMDQVMQAFRDRMEEAPATASAAFHDLLDQLRALPALPHLAKLKTLLAKVACRGAAGLGRREG